MFSKAPRFREPKPSDIPGPGAYDPVDIDEIFTGKLKRGAFLEKADRFDPNKPSDTPGPNTYAPAQTQAGPSRLAPMASAVMKQQLDALRTRLEKEHQRELQQFEARATRAEARNQELSKEHAAFRSAASHAERELRMTLQRESSLKASLEKTEATLDQLRQRVVDHAGLQTKLAELEVQYLDSKRQQNDQIARLERERGQERKEHTLKLQELEKTMREKLQDATRARDTSAECNRRLQSEMTEMSERLGNVQSSHDEMRYRALRSEERVHQMDELVQQTTNAYSNMASISKRSDAARRTYLEKARLELSSLRLGRKLADREAQVTELTHLIRHISRQNHLLLDELSCAQEQIASLRTTDFPLDTGGNFRLVDVTNLALDAARLQLDDEETTTLLLRKLHRLDMDFSSTTKLVLSRTLDELFHHTTMAERHENQAGLVIGHYEHQVPLLAEKVTLLETSLAAKQGELEERDVIVGELHIREAESQRRMRETEECLSQQVEETRKARSYQVGQVKSLNGALARARMEEAALEAQVASLESSLSEAIKIQDEHQELVKRVDILVSRNALAEDEAKYLSEFNAHLLGHSNLNQRIFYVDRLRKEMSELKQKLLTAEWERDMVSEKNADLIRELDTYRSVDEASRKPPTIFASLVSGSKSGTPPDPTQREAVNSPPRTIMTRVRRQPLGLRSINGGEEAREQLCSLESAKTARIGDGNARMTLADLGQ